MFILQKLDYNKRLVKLSYFSFIESHDTSIRRIQSLSSNLNWNIKVNESNSHKISYFKIN